jgi:hypothetical protein
VDRVGILHREQLRAPKHFAFGGVKADRFQRDVLGRLHVVGPDSLPDNASFNRQRQPDPVAQHHGR